MSRVFIKTSSYDYGMLRPRIFELMEACGGRRIAAGSRVLIKPNFLSPARPETAVCTHPLVTRAVVEYVLERGARPRVSDSPATGSFERALKESGTLDALKGMNVECKPFRSSLAVQVGSPFGEIDLAEDALKADFVINLAKLKTHNLMVLTLGVKNLFGCVIGLKKPEWHLKMGDNMEMLARLFIRIHEAIKPGITIIDGILAMEGEGPGRGGKPKPLGILMGSTDAYAIDRAVCAILGIDPDRIPINRCARQMGLAPESIELEGVALSVRDFQFPGGGGSLTGKLQGMARRFLVAVPVVESDDCTACAACRDVCPASAILIEGRKIEFDYDKCISCYCCAEVCPQGALKLKAPAIGKILKRVLKF